SRHDNIEKARLLRDIAGIYLEKNQFNDAESLAKKSLKYLESRQHADTYRAYEFLGDLYLKKALLTNNKQERQAFKIRAIKQYTQALKMAEQHLCTDSAHVHRIFLKINNQKDGL